MDGDQESVHIMDSDGRASTPVQGAQVVSRIGALLRAIAAHPDGVGSSTVATETGLRRPTVHRLLTAMAAEGLVEQDQKDGLWRLGPELFVYGSVATARYDVTRAARTEVRRLAALTGESAFFSVRRGDETVCLLREEGTFPLRSFVLYEGKRFPLGVASAGLAILALSSDTIVEDYLSRTDLTREHGSAHAEAPLRLRIEATRRTGYAVNPGLIVEGSWGMGAAVFDAHGSPEWALSLTGVESRFSESRRPELGRLLLDRAHALSQILGGRAES